jgi:Tetratricopeptide repeat
MRRMKLRLLAGVTLLASVVATASPAFAQQILGPVDASGHFQLALPDRKGALEWDAPGYEVAQMTVKPGSREIGVRGVNKGAKLMFIAFIFAVDDPVASAATCRTGDITENTQDPDIKVTGKTDVMPSPRPAGAAPDAAPPARVPVVEYARKNASGEEQDAVAAFVGAGKTCASIEFTGEDQVHLSTPALAPIISSMRFVPGYAPQFKDVFLYGMIFYDKQDFKNAAPYLERAIALAEQSPDPLKWTRVATDNAGIAYGISGNTAQARKIFEAAIAKDSDYPMYYYNLACADAADKNLDAAKKHLEQAFERKANVIAGETLPDPKTDDSFTPYKSDAEFWKFVSALK